MKIGSMIIKDTDMYYVSFGHGKKNLVVIPGLSDGLATVKGKALLLASPYKKFFKDYRVYMFSRKNNMPEGYSIKEMADDQATVMNALGIEKAYVLGVSQGGMIAQYLAINHPEMVEKLILAVTAPYANEIVKENVGAWIDLAKQNDHKTLMIDTAEKMYTREYLEKYRKLYSLTTKFTKPKSYERFLRNAYAIMSFDARKEIYKIQCPTLIICGSDDLTVGNKAAYELKEYISDNQIYEYKGLGHGCFDEAKDFYDKVYDFCESK